MAESNQSPSSPAVESCAARDSREAPTSEEINQLPDHIRDWIHDLETRCDRQGDLRRLRAAKQKAEQAEAALAEVEDDLRDYIERLRDRAESHFENYKEGSTLDANFADAYNEVADELEQMI